MSTASISSNVSSAEQQIAQNDQPPPPYRPPSLNGMSPHAAVSNPLIDLERRVDAIILPTSSGRGDGHTSETINDWDQFTGGRLAIDEGVDPLLINNMQTNLHSCPSPNHAPSPQSISSKQCCHGHPDQEIPAPSRHRSREDVPAVDHGDPTPPNPCPSSPPPGNNDIVTTVHQGQQDSVTSVLHGPTTLPDQNQPDPGSPSPPSCGSSGNQPGTKLTIRLPASPSKLLVANEKPLRKRPMFPVIIRRPRPSPPPTPPPRRNKRRAASDVASRKRSKVSIGNRKGKRKVVEDSDGMDVDDEDDDDSDETQAESEEGMEVDEDIHEELPRLEVKGDKEVCLPSVCSKQGCLTSFLAHDLRTYPSLFR